MVLFSSLQKNILVFAAGFSSLYLFGSACLFLLVPIFALLQSSSSTMTVTF